MATDTASPDRIAAGGFVRMTSGLLMGFCVGISTGGYADYFSVLGLFFARFGHDE